MFILSTQVYPIFVKVHSHYFYAVNIVLLKLYKNNAFSYPHILSLIEVFRIFDRMFQKRPFHDLYIYICKYRDAKLQMVRYYRVCNVSAIADLVFALLAGGPF